MQLTRHISSLPPNFISSYNFYIWTTCDFKVISSRCMFLISRMSFPEGNFAPNVPRVPIRITWTNTLANVLSRTETSSHIKRVCRVDKKMGLEVLHEYADVIQRITDIYVERRLSLWYLKLWIDSTSFRKLMSSFPALRQSDSTNFLQLTQQEYGGDEVRAFIGRR